MGPVASFEQPKDLIEMASKHPHLEFAEPLLVLNASSYFWRGRNLLQNSNVSSHFFEVHTKTRRVFRRCRWHSAMRIWLMERLPRLLRACDHSCPRCRCLRLSPKFRIWKKELEKLESKFTTLSAWGMGETYTKMGFEFEGLGQCRLQAI